MRRSEADDEAPTTGGNSPLPSPSQANSTARPETDAGIIAVRSAAEGGGQEASTAETPGAAGRSEGLVDPNGEAAAGLGGPEKGACVVVDVDWPAEAEEKVCRICHLSPENGGPEETELIQLGCACKGELGFGHRHCAETWFRVKGNRSCEICGMNAKNIIGEEHSNFVEEWHEGRTLGGSTNRNLQERGSCWKSQPFCNFLMACLVVAFIFPWFFRVNLF